MLLCTLISLLLLLAQQCSAGASAGLKQTLPVADLPSSANCTWKYIEQPLSHFAKGDVGTYQERVCIYSDYWEPDQGLPVFFYTGNESPVEEYVNNTGLIWTLAAEFNALVIFAEHRYFGESIPEIAGMPSCLSYLSADEALADYAAIINTARREWGVGQEAAVVAFGGSYGGMLSSWMRILYPSAIDGAIAASAPIWGFPLTDCAPDSSAQVVTYAASPAAGAAPRCADNLKASYVLASDIAATESGRALVSEAMNLCTPLESTSDVTALLSYLQTPLFDLAEGSYPFPTDYITFALTSSTAPLPPWPMQVMCEGLARDFGVSINLDEGTEAADVKFTVLGAVNDGIDSSSEVAVQVDWDRTSNNGYSEQNVRDTGIPKLLAATAQAIQVWYNVTGDAPSCIDWAAGSAPNSNKKTSTSTTGPASDSAMTKQALLSRILLEGGSTQPLSRYSRADSHSFSLAGPPVTATATATAAAEPSPTGPLDKNADHDDDSSSSEVCTMARDEFDVGTAWNSLVCNEGINLVNWWAQGTGSDLYWPPNVPRDYSLVSLVPGSLDYCKILNQPALSGLAGLPRKLDDWAYWVDTAFGGLRLQYASNIVFSNGNLDPWSTAGVALTMDVSGLTPADIDMQGNYIKTATAKYSAEQYDDENLGMFRDDSVVSVMIDMGAHHLDLFWPTEDDPTSVRVVRAIERERISKWIEEAALLRARNSRGSSRGRGDAKAIRRSEL